MARTSLQAAIDEVATRDPVLAQLVARVGRITHRPRDPDGPFGALVRAIVYQQLAGRAAEAIHGRLRTTVGEALTPATVAATPDPALRAAGLSANKLASLRDLSAPETTRTARRPLPPLPLDRRPLLLGSRPAPPTKQHPTRTPLTSPPTRTSEGGHVSTKLPDVVSRYFERDADRDSDSIIGLFAEDATVIDEGETRHGTTEIRAWQTGAASKYTYTTEITSAEALGPDRYLVTGRLTGNFPGGTADLKWDFTIAGQHITKLVIAP